MADDRPYQPTSTASLRPTGVAPAAARSTLPPVSDAERVRIQRTIATARESCPELIDLVKQLYELGMIDGWRAVTITKENDALPI